MVLFNLVRQDVRLVVRDYAGVEVLKGLDLRVKSALRGVCAQNLDQLAIGLKPLFYLDLLFVRRLPNIQPLRLDVAVEGTDGP